ncbi:hypothetical protein C8R48DRAFT_334050 [Suillus tomentosus]|nr:hypothetical protein C8R48DRAFT_334050 [Suillus tomentosus]
MSEDDVTLPQYFYRVFDEQSCSQLNHSGAFVASIPYAVYDRDHRNARGQLERHMDWSNRRRTPFISVTCSRAKALEFALTLLNMGSQAVSIAKIDSSRLEREGTNVYWMCDLVEYTGAYIKPEAMNKHEFLCGGLIPANAVIQCFTLGDDDDDDDDDDDYDGN